MQQIAVSLTGLTQKKVTSGLTLPEMQTVIVTPRHDPFTAIIGLPGADIVRATPGIEPFMIQALIPDLLYLAQLGRLAEAITRADPQNPQSIIWNDPTQKIHDETAKVEMDILTGQIDIAQSDQSCINPACKKKTVAGPFTKQRRSNDEPPSAQYRCTTCKRQWTINL